MRQPDRTGPAWGPAPQAGEPLLLGMGWFPDQPGGLNRYFRGLLDALRAEGVPHRAVVVGPASDPPPGVAVVSDRAAPLAHRVLRFAEAVRGVRADRGPVCLVDAHFCLYGLVPAVLGSVRKLPLVVHFQGPWADEGRSSRVGGMPRLVAKRLVERAVYRRAREVVVLSGAFRRVLVERYGIVPWRVSVIPPGVDLARFCPGPPAEIDARAEARRRLGLPLDASVVVAVRRLVPRMGVGVLLEAWSLVLDGLDEKARGRSGSMLLIVGDGPERTRLEAQARALGIAGATRFAGTAGDAELVDCYRAADLSVTPTLELEGFGLVVLESLACGTPALVTGCDALPETVARLDPGLIVPAGDAEALAERLRGALDGTQPPPSRGRCRAFAEQFSWSRAAARNLEVYRRAMDPAPPRRKLRVVYLDHCARLSGGELALLRLLPALEEVERHVVLAEDGPLAARLVHAGVSVEVLPMAEAARGLPRGSVRPGAIPLRSVAGSAAYVVRVARMLVRYRPDIVHTNSLKAALYGILAARLARVPVVWHLRDRVADDYLPPAALGLLRRLARLPAAVVANSQATLDTLGTLRCPGYVIASPVPTPAVCAGDRSRPADALRVGMVGRLAPWKGQHLFLEAFAHAF
ncbi:MAG TPA: glycosyltransferase, partial [Actinomycetota bacterium]